MRGRYKTGQRRVLTGNVYKIVIAVTLVMALALVLLLLAFLPAVDDTIIIPKTIINIEPELDGNISLNDDPQRIYVTVNYTDGTSERIPLSNTQYEGLDLTVEGKQTVVLSFGGTEQEITFNVGDNSCEVVYEASLGGSIGGETVQRVVSGGNAMAVTAIPGTGYVFDGWNDGYPNAYRKDLNVTENKKYIANFTKARYTVRFFYDNGTVANEEKVFYGEAPSKVPNPDSDPEMQKYGYIFNGWIPNNFTEIDRDTDIRPDYVRAATDVIMTVPTDLYGNAMGSAPIREEGYYAHNKMATIVATPYNSREFAYWLVSDFEGNQIKVDKSGSATVKVGAAGQELTFTSNRSGNTVQDYTLSFTPTSDVAQINIQAIFAYSNSDIKFINYQNPDNNNLELTVNGLPYGTPLNEYRAGGVDLTVGLPEPKSVTGMQFLGWYVMGDNTQTVIDGSETFEQPATLVAKWRRQEYTVIFNYTDEAGDRHDWHTVMVVYQDALASGRGTSAINPSGSQNGFPAVNPTRRNYRFVGWQDALTGASVDAKTALYAEKEHLDNSDFVNHNILRIIPIWAPISHRLYVNVQGAGKAELIINPDRTDANGNPITERTEVLGEYVIYENNKYVLNVEAASGYEIDSITWYYGNELNSVDVPGDHMKNASIALLETGENRVYISFKVMKLNIEVVNGDSSYFGYVEYGGEINAADKFSLTVDYNTNAELKILSYSDVYSIADVKVNGVSIGNVFDDGTLEYTLTLPTVREDMKVEIVYSSRRYSVSIHAGDGGAVYITDVFNRPLETPAQAYGEYLYGSQIYFRVKGDGVKNIVKSMRFNGTLIDLFTDPENDITLYGWEINGKSYGIEFIFAEDRFYYSYGEVEIDGINYVYCEDAETFETRLFVKTESYGEDVYSVFSSGADNYRAVFDRLSLELDIASRSLTNTSVWRDGRITSLDFRLTVRRDCNFNFTFDEIKYTVEASADGNGDVEVLNASPSYGETSVITATPKAGYYVSGYRINGGETVPVYSNRRGESFRLTLNGVNEDKSAEFDFEEITHRVLVINGNIGAGDVFANGTKLNSSAAFEYAYHGTAEIELTVGEGKRIASVLVDGVSYSVHYNAESYLLVLSDITEDKTVTATVAEKLPQEETGSVYTVDTENVTEAEVSSRYIKCGVSTENSILVTARFGRKLTGIELTGSAAGKRMSFDTDDFGTDSAEYEFTVPAGYFEAGETVRVAVTTESIAYVLTVRSEGNGSVTGGHAVYYGDSVGIIVNAAANHHIESFKANGEEVSFGANGWSGLVNDLGTGKYTYGQYTFFANRDMDVEVKFAVNNYRVSVEDSINGSTLVSLENGVSEYAPHGSFLYINMQADMGYHIAALYINDALVTDIDFDGSDANDRTAATYVYKGTTAGGAENGVTGRMRIRVIYDINRYSLLYSIVNESINFANDANPGAFSAAYTLEGNRYTGIEHGSNFSFDVTPAVSNGYYLYQIKITYYSLSHSRMETVTHVLGDGAFTARGGTLWFNRFVDSDDGVVENIELIEVTFKRNFYTVTLNQLSEEDTGSMHVSFSHPTGSISEAILLDGDDNRYYYRARDGIFYINDGNGYTATDITLVYDDGVYVYRDGNGKIYEMRAEHGLRYSVTARPSVGYERIGFTVNGEDMSNSVNDNVYSVNLVRDVTVAATYRILTYDVSFSLSVIDKNLTSVIPTISIMEYATVRIEVLNGTVYDDNYNLLQTVTDEPYVFNLEFNRDALVLSNLSGGARKLGYGSRIRFVMSANFDNNPDFGGSGTGYYLYNFFFNDNEITALQGDRTSTTYYAGTDIIDGQFVSANLSARCSFRIMTYRVSPTIEYSEDIRGENINRVEEENGGTVAWGDDGYVRVDVGDGYKLKEIRVKRGDGTETIVNLIDSQDNPAFSEQWCEDLQNPNTGAIRDVLVIKDIKTAVSVTVAVERQEFTVNYVFNDADKLSSVTTEFNKNNRGYPSSTVVGNNSPSSGGHWEGANIHWFEARYYDEIEATLVSKNGYEILGGTVTVRSVVRDEATGEWTPVVDNSNRPITATLDIINLGNDRKYFTFHSETSAVAFTYIASDVLIEIELDVKKYDLTTTVNRVNAINSENNAEISVSVTDINGNSIVLPDGTTQMAQLLTPSNPGSAMRTEHHGRILYSFNAPEGYVLTSVTVNGITYDNFRSVGFTDERLSYSGIRNGGNAPYYSYTLSFAVNDALINALNYGGSGGIDVRLNIMPITYTVKTYINGTAYENALINGLSGATDGKTLTVYSPATVGHTNTLALRPEGYEGYRVVGLRIMTGTEAEGTDETSFATGNPSANRVLAMTNGFMPYIDVMQDKTTLHLYYTDEIIRYGVNIDAFAYSTDSSLVTGGSGIVDFDSSAGTVNVYVTTDGNSVEYRRNTSYDYFSTVRVDARAKEGYKLYNIVEIIDGTEREIVDGERGIRYFTTTEDGGATAHSFVYTVDGYGAREFRVVYKQQTKIRVNVPNPYKYSQGSTAIGEMNYEGYVAIAAYENGARLQNVSNAAMNALPGEYVYEYVFDVLVGNFVSFEYTDLNSRSDQTGYRFCVYNGTDYVDAGLYNNPAYPNGSGLVITENIELHLINNVFGRVTFVKETNGALKDSVGGIVYFNNSGSEPNNGYLSSRLTTVYNNLTLTVRPDDNYVFSNLYVRQVDEVASRRAGRMIFKSGASEWLAYSDSFNSQDSNGIEITRIDNGSGYPTFNIKMKGDMEIRVEFYRVYELRYGVDYTDKEPVYFNPDNVPTDEKYRITLSDIVNNEYAELYGGDGQYMQFEAGFTLEAPSAPDGYVFVGWYVNGINTYKYLDTILPGDGYLSRQFRLTAEETEGLVVNGNESETMMIVAKYQPIINVALINELYYYNEFGEGGSSEKHWNSWASGALWNTAYAFDGRSIPEFTTAKAVSNIRSKQISQIDYSAIDTLAGGDRSWNTLAKDVSLYNIPTTNYVYSEADSYKVLYENIMDGDFIGDSWDVSKIQLSLGSMPSSVKFLGWQYFNWGTGTYENISYTYEDANYGVDENGNWISVDYTYEEYDFSLGYLFSGNMPNAISKNSVNNEVNERPLVIRPRLWKVVRVDLSQIAYTNDLGGEYIVDFNTIIHPVIDSFTNASVYSEIDADGGYGEFDYGATINIKYYDRTADSPLGGNGVVNYDQTLGTINERYRFIGWRLNWNVGNITDFRYITTDDDISGYDMRLSYTFDDDPPNEAMELQAVYVKQYRHSLYSYNVAYSDENYESALIGSAARYNAPSMDVNVTDKTVTFASYNPTDKTVGSVDLPYVLNVLDGVSNPNVWSFMADAGSDYKIDVLTKEDERPSESDDLNKGYDPKFDKEYRVFHNKGLEGEEEITDENSPYRGETVRVQGIFSLDLQYASTVRMRFNNLMFSSGIVVPAELALYLTDGNTDKLTVWDVNDFGDSVMDGTVNMEFRLVNARNFFGRFDYALTGFKDGVGLAAVKEIIYYPDGGSTSSGNNLFNATDVSFRRYVEIDYSDGYMNGYVDSGDTTPTTLIFGDKNYRASDSVFDISNTGDGTEENPFRIFSATQLRNVGLFFHYNENSCLGVHFGLYNDIKLQNVGTKVLADPGVGTEAWVPICHYYDENTRTHLGFDGVLNGNGHAIFGLAASGNNITPPSGGNSGSSGAVATNQNPMAEFIDYTTLSGYGIFGCINGGVINDLVIGNAYMNFGSVFGTTVQAVPTYLGVLTARAYGASFNRIDFRENQPVGRTNETGSPMRGINGSRVYIMSTSTQSAGLLAGYASGISMNDVSVTVSTASNTYYGIEINVRGNAGALIGELADNGNRETSYSELRNVSLTGQAGSTLTMNIRSGLTSRNTGGLFGSVSGGARIVNASVSGNFSLYIGNQSASNVGGIVGAIVNSTITGAIVSSANRSNRNSETTGIFLNAAGGATELGNGVTLEDAHGKTGGIAGLAYASDIRVTDDTVTDISGVIRFYAAYAGAVAGVSANNSLIQGFDLKGPSYTVAAERLYLMFREVRGSQNGFGGIAGANIGSSVINDCSFTGGSSVSPTAAGTELGGSHMYVYRKDSDSDYAYQSIYSNSNSGVYNSMKKTAATVNAESLYVGGLVGYNTAKVYNSFTRNTRVTVKYENGGMSSGTSWKVYVGGIVGYFNVAETQSTYYGIYSILNYENNINIIESRVQSCYTDSSSIAVIGYIWCDSIANSDVLQELAANLSVAGIVGSMSTNSHGGYAINSCYANKNNFIVDLGAYGMSTSSESALGQSYGYLTTKEGGFIGIGQTTYYTPYRAGINIDNSVFGIVGASDAQDVMTSANYCWANGNTVTRSSEKAFAEKTDDGGKRTTDRGLRYNGDAEISASANRSSRNGPLHNDSEDIGYWDYGSLQDWQSHSDVIGSIFIGGKEIQLSSIGILPIGGFAGAYEAADGRVYKTDVATGELVVGHGMQAAGAADLQVYWWQLVDGEIQLKTTIDMNSSDDTYWAFYSGLSADRQNELFVRGQGNSPLTV